MTSRTETEALLARYIALVSQFTQHAQQLQLQEQIQTDCNCTSSTPLLSRSSTGSSNSSTSSSSSICSATSSPLITPSTSPTFFHHAKQYPIQLHSQSFSSNDTYTIAEDAQTSEELMSGLTRQIKATLTSLLNLPSVKQDREMRGWVQERLMEVEKQMRKMRRRTHGGGRTSMVFKRSQVLTA